MEFDMTKPFDFGSVLIIAITFVLFVIALFVKGLTKDLLLEAGVLLVSIKLIMMAYKTRITNEIIKQELGEIKKMIQESRGPEVGATEPQRAERQ